MKTITTVFFIILFALSTFAEGRSYKGDTISCRFDNMLIELATGNGVQGIAVDELQSQIKELQEILKEIVIAPPKANERIFVTVQRQDGYIDWNYKTIELLRSDQENKNLVVFDDGTIYERELGQYCISFLAPKTDLNIYVDKLDDLDFIFSETYNAKMSEAQALIQKNNEGKARKRILVWLDLRNDIPKANYSNEANLNYDIFIISGGLGSGWVKNTFVSDINFSLGLSFGNKGLYKNSYSVAWNMMYDFSNSSQNKFFELNHFVSLVWDHNFSNSPKQDKWYGFSFGYLAKRNNDFFNENTFRIGANKRINDTFSVKSELYFNDFFKSVYPGIRLSVAF